MAFPLIQGRGRVHGDRGPLLERSRTERLMGQRPGGVSNRESRVPSRGSLQVYGFYIPIPALSHLELVAVVVGLAVAATIAAGHRT